MRERFQLSTRLLKVQKRKKARRPLLILVGVLVGFLVIVTSRLDPPDPESRLPGPLRLAALIDRQQQDNETQREATAALRSQIDQESQSAQGRRNANDSQIERVSEVSKSAGTQAVKGRGFVVTLADSPSRDRSNNQNDLVIHSADVQAVVNALWAAGAEAISINDQRVVATSAILCVGNTLLINGSVHSPPYEIASIGAQASKFTADPLVREFKDDAERYSLRFAVGREGNVEIPAYSGPVVPTYARVADQ